MGKVFQKYSDSNLRKYWSDFLDISFRLLKFHAKDVANLVFINNIHKPSVAINDIKSKKNKIKSSFHWFFFLLLVNCFGVIGIKTNNPSCGVTGRHSNSASSHHLIIDYFPVRAQHKVCFPLRRFFFFSVFALFKTWISEMNFSYVWSISNPAHHSSGDTSVLGSSRVLGSLKGFYLEYFLIWKLCVCRILLTTFKTFCRKKSSFSGSRDEAFFLIIVYGLFWGQNPGASKFSVNVL